jgi:hypothetical protein
MTKRFVCCMALASVIAVGARSSAGNQSKTAATGAVLGVEALMGATSRPSGTLRVAGVVSAVSPKEKRLALIDLRELDECGKTTCAEFTLPVERTGTMPAVRDVVRVVGFSGTFRDAPRSRPTCR